MKKRILTLLVAVVMVLGAVWNPSYTVQAEDTEPEIDSSFLITEAAIVGDTVQPMGIYLLDGRSSITKNSTLTIGAGGSTVATQRCDVSVAVIVEQYKNGGWVYWHSWVDEEENAFSVATSKTLAVARGYSYRVRCTHKAATDAASSWTGALQM